MAKSDVQLDLDLLFVPASAPYLSSCPLSVNSDEGDRGQGSLWGRESFWNIQSI